MFCFYLAGQGCVALTYIYTDNDSQRTSHCGFCLYVHNAPPALTPKHHQPSKTLNLNI